MTSYVVRLLTKKTNVNIMASSIEQVNFEYLIPGYLLLIHLFLFFQFEDFQTYGGHPIKYATASKRPQLTL